MALLFASCGPALADVFAGHVVDVIDGDTLTVVDASRQQRKVRLSGIDAPERTQRFGDAAKTALSRQLFNRDVSVEWTKHERDCLVGRVIVLSNPGCQGLRCPGVDAGLQQLRTGMAWWDRKAAAEQTATDQLAYQQAEFEAQTRRLGLWSDKAPLPPSAWRREP